jgi:two-component system OmpR family response regulator
MALEGLHDILIVDRMLFKLDGLSIIAPCEQGVTFTVLILSALSDVDERVKGLRAGGDDYSRNPMPSPSFLPGLKAWAGAAPGAAGNQTQGG